MICTRMKLNFAIEVSELTQPGAIAGGITMVD